MNIDLSKEILETVGILGLDRMPTVKELRDNKMGALEQRISKNGGFTHWAEKLGLSKKVQTTKWTDEVIETQIREVMSTLNLDRMPVRAEIDSVGRGDLHNAICRSYGYTEWSNKLSLELKDCETHFAHSFEDKFSKILSDKGFEVERMTTKHPFDILINGKIKMDVKTGRAYMLNGKNRTHTFGINKKYGSCDLYAIIALDEDDEIERIFIIPSHHLQVVTLSIGSNKTKYDKYLDRYDLIDEYEKFLSNIK